MLIWLQLVACAALIGVAGVRLSHYGDVIAEKSGASRTWIGVVLLATITSLPELVTGLSSVTIAQTPDIALGDVMGSCVFNLFILVIVDFLHRRESAYTRAAKGHLLSAGFGVVMIGYSGFAILLSHLGIGPRIGHVGVSTLVILALYAVAMRTVFRYERDDISRVAEEYRGPFAGSTLRQASWGYARWALVVIAAGAWLPFVGERLSEAMGWEQSFVGSLFIAFSTSLPEVAVTIAAVRMGALDLAIGNLLGSNLFNVAVLAIDDLAYVRGPLFAHVSLVHAVSAQSAVMMTGLAIIGLFYRPRTRLFRVVGWTSLFLFMLYLLNSFILFVHGN
jgi:cation:H+ antiporter